MVCSLSVSGAVRLREKERSHFPVCGQCKSVAGVSLIGSLVVENLSHVRNTVLAKFRNVLSFTTEAAGKKLKFENKLSEP